MHLEELLKIIEENLPAATAMDGDRIGLQIQSGRNETASILVALEINDEVVDEALNNKNDCIITFHPLIFVPLTSIKDDNRVGKLCSRLIKNSISLISIHTNFDAFSEGTSKILADLLDLRVSGFLQPDNNFENKGMGVIAEPKYPISPDELLDKVHQVCASPIRYSSLDTKNNINKIAIVGGSGTSFMKNAINSGSQAFITADVTYHRFHEVDEKLMLIDPGHYEMEQFVPKAMAQLLKEKTNDSNININVSGSYTNPVNYYPETEKYIKMQKQNLLNINMVV